MRNVYKSSSSYKLLCFLIFVLINYIPIQVGIFNITFGVSVFVFAIALITFSFYLFADSRFKKIIKSSNSIIWLLLCFYHITNTLLFKSYDTDIITHPLIIFSQLLTPYMMMMIVFYSANRNFITTVKVVLISLVINLFITYLSTITGDYNNNRLGNSFFGANTFGHLSAILSSFLTLYLLNKNKNFLSFMFYQSFPIFFVFMSASRAGLGVILINIVGYLIGISLKRKKKIGVNITLSIITLMIGLIIIEDSTILHRILDLKNQSIETQLKGYSTGTFLDLLGDRTSYYVLGWEIFLKNPVSGIGIWNYRDYSGSYNVMHPEYLVHLVEGGIIAFVLFFMFYFRMFSALSKKHIRRNGLKPYAIVILFGLSSFMFLFLSSRGLFNLYLFCYLGVVQSFILTHSR